MNESFGGALGAWIERTRRNHAIEHAAIAVLFERLPPGGGVAALSDPWGFGILSRFDADEVGRASEEALARLRAGQTQLAITDLCGSNLVVGGALATIAVLTVGRGKWRNLPAAISAAALAGVATKPVGRWVQQTLTTDTSGMDALQIRSVKALRVSDTHSLTRVNIGSRG